MHFTYCSCWHVRRSNPSVSCALASLPTSYMVTHASPPLSPIKTVSNSLLATQAHKPPTTTKSQMISTIKLLNSRLTLCDPAITRSFVRMMTVAVAVNTWQAVGLISGPRYVYFWFIKSNWKVSSGLTSLNLKLVGTMIDVSPHSVSLLHWSPSNWLSLVSTMHLA